MICLMQLIAQALVNGILFGTMYGTAAIGLSLIFGTMRIVFMAQGSIIIFFPTFVSGFSPSSALIRTSP